MKKKLYAPLLTLALSLTVLAACEQKADAAVRSDAAAPVKTQAVVTSPADLISEAKAREIAFTHAGVKETDAAFLTAALDYDDGIWEYEVEFYVGTTEYDFDIDAATGTIRSFDFEIEDSHSFTVSGNTAASKADAVNSAAGISESDAKKIALAQVAGAAESNIREFEADMDDGRLVYEGEIRYNGIEYEFEIDAATGTIVDWDADYDD